MIRDSLYGSRFGVGMQGSRQSYGVRGSRGSGESGGYGVGKGSRGNVHGEGMRMYGWSAENNNFNFEEEDDSFD